MMKNVGSLDRTLRVVAGGALVAATLAGLVGPWGWLGLLPIASGLLRFCPAYLPFGFSTCGRDGARGKP